MTWLHDQQFQMMVQRWRSDNPGQEPDEKTIDTLRIQAQMIVDDIARSQYLEEREFRLYCHECGWLHVWYGSSRV
ncbi:MAG TPA: hypothetical protein PLK19_17670, partial [Mycobacterium sp.]|nr:hypothetical protein [Mycobacterium sp.]